MSSPNQQLWKCRDLEFRLGKHPLIMGILNLTPDSFSDGGRYNSPDAAIQRAQNMIDQGADIIDIGGESTRPGAEPVSAEQEIARILPVIRVLAQNPKAVMSVDTCKSSVAEAALKAGAHIINDVTGLTGDRNMAEVVQRYRAGLVIMHMQGTPRTMQLDPSYQDVVREVSDFLAGQIGVARGIGISIEQVVVDPGIGFGKTLEHNLELLRNISRIAQASQRPVLIGVSRKRFIGTITGREPGDRLAGSLAAMAFAIKQGAHIIRVHDVKESCDVGRMMATLGSTEDD